MYLGSLIGWQWVGKKRRKAEAAKADKDDNKGKASAVQTIMRLMEKVEEKCDK